MKPVLAPECLHVDAADQTVAFQDREDVVAVLALRLGNEDLDPASIDVQLRTSEHRSMYSYVRLSIRSSTATTLSTSMYSSTV